MNGQTLRFNYSTSASFIVDYRVGSIILVSKIVCCELLGAGMI